jgi:outer membrane protein OmpA-like peptidoglycan-associated protein
MSKRLGLLWVLSLYLSAGSVSRAEVTDHPEPTTTQSTRRGNLPFAQKAPSEGEGEGISAAANQSDIDRLFNTIKASAVGYTFDYVMIMLPANSLPGIQAPIPVAHIRYRETVFFAFDKYYLAPRGEAAVLDFANAIRQDKLIRSILIVGHTDSIGTDDYNLLLSKNRAVAVAAVLRNNGVEEKYLGLVPMGKAQPLATNKTSSGRASNRRVEFFFSDIPGAAEKAVEQIQFNPCDIDSSCPPPRPIPVYDATGRTMIAQLDLTRGAIPSTPDGPRPAIPVEPQQHKQIPSNSDN